jgi:hypothetical protein
MYASLAGLVALDCGHDAIALRIRELRERQHYAADTGGANPQPVHRNWALVVPQVEEVGGPRWWSIVINLVDAHRRVSTLDLGEKIR